MWQLAFRKRKFIKMKKLLRPHRNIPKQMVVLSRLEKAQQQLICRIRA